jgi:hypothetical protein
MTTTTTAPSPGPHKIKTVHAYEDESALPALIRGLLDDPDPAIDRGMLEEFGRPWGADFGLRSGGDLVLLTEGGAVVAGGGYRRYDSTTAQAGWLWTRTGRRRIGLAERVLTELETSAVWRGYGRMYAVVGPGQIAARRLLTAGGYRALGRRACADDYLGFVRAVGWEA